MSPAPPPVARWVLSYCLPDDIREAVLGDLEEVFALGGGGPRAARRYRIQVARSVLPTLTTGLAPGRLGRALGALTLGFVTMWVVGDAALAGSRGLATVVLGEAASGEAVGWITFLSAMLPTCVLAGYLTAHAGGHAGRLAALVLSLVVVVPALIAPLFGHGGDPLWARSVWILGGFAATVAGSAIRPLADGLPGARL
ncbi:MAG: hypothetical protein R3195_17235 [Gemmatimonadota bacterium]|nr:hypothetical protein [Gemmatimonadota bacterium]